MIRWMIVAASLLVVNVAYATDTTLELLSVVPLPSGVQGLSIAPDGRRAAALIVKNDDVQLVRLSMPGLQPVDTVSIPNTWDLAEWSPPIIAFGADRLYACVGADIWRVRDDQHQASNIVVWPESPHCRHKFSLLQQIGLSDSLLFHSEENCQVMKWNTSETANVVLVDTSMDTIRVKQGPLPSSLADPRISHDRRTFSVSSVLFRAGFDEQRQWVATASFHDSLVIRRFDTLVADEFASSSRSFPAGEPGWVLWEASLSANGTRMYIVDLSAKTLREIPRRDYLGNVGPMGLMLGTRSLRGDGYELQVIDLAEDTVWAFDTIATLPSVVPGSSVEMLCIGDTLIVHSTKEMRTYRRTIGDRRGTVAIHRTRDSVSLGERVLHNVELYEQSRARRFRWYVNDVEAETTQQPFFVLQRFQAGAYVVRVEVLDTADQPIQRGTTTTPCNVLDPSGIIIAMRASSQKIEAIDVSASGRFMAISTADTISVWELDDSSQPIVAKRIMTAAAYGTALFKPGTDTLQWFRCEHGRNARSGGTFTLHSGFAIPPSFDTVAVATMELPDSLLWLPTHDGRRVLLRSIFDPYTELWALGIEGKYQGQYGLYISFGVMAVVEPAPRSGIRLVSPSADIAQRSPWTFRFSVGPRPYIGNVSVDNVLLLYDLSAAAYRSKLTLPWGWYRPAIFHDASTIISLEGVFTVADTTVTLWGAYERLAWDVFSIPSTDHAVYYLYDTSVVARIFNVRTLQIDQWLRGPEMRPSCSAYDRRRHALFIGAQSGLVTAYGLRIPTTTSLQMPREGSADARLLSLVPNPASTLVQVMGLDPLAVSQVQAIDMVGHRTTLTCTGSMIDVGCLSPGIYTVRIMVDGRVFSTLLRIIR